MSHKDKKRKIEIEEVDSAEVSEGGMDELVGFSDLPSLLCVTLTPGTGTVAITPKLPDVLMNGMFEQMTGVAPLDNFMISLNFLYTLQYKLFKLKIVDLSNQVAYLEREEMGDGDEMESMSEPQDDDE